MNKKFTALVSLCIVVILWGTTPLVLSFLYEYFSPAIYVFITALISFSILFITNFKKLKLLNARYFKIAVPFGIFYVTANILQKLGYPYTTPSRYSFLENAQIISMPFLAFVFTKKKPSLVQIIAAILCTVSALFLCNINFSEKFSIGIGELMCFLAGLFFGVNIAGTGAYAKDMDSRLYIMIQSGVQLVLGLITALILNYVKVDGEPIQAIKVSSDFKVYLLLIVYIMIVTTLCLVLRTYALKHLSSTFATILMSFSSVISLVGSVFLGKDILSWNLIIGSALCFGSILLASLGDMKKKPRKINEENCQVNL